MARTSGGTIPADSRSIIKSDTFGGLVSGDKVRVNLSDDPVLAKFSGMIYEFVWHMTNIENGKQWATLWGGPPNHQAWLSVATTRITKVDTGRNR